MRPCLRRLALVVAVAAVAAGACGPGNDRPPLAGLPAGGPCGGRWGEAEQAGTLPGDRREVSGFVTSAWRENVAWMVRDSGNPASVYSFGVDRDGSVSSVEFPVEGATNGDWEDVAATVEDGRGRLWILDNINRHSSPKTIWVVAEPAPGQDGPAELLGRYDWHYPDGNHDTETLFSLGGRLVVVSKTEPSRAYVFDRPLVAGGLNIPRLVGEVTGPRLVFGSTTADERLLVTSSTRTDTVYVSDVATGWTGGAEPVFEQEMPAAQREAGDFFPHDGCDIILLDERETIWRLANQRSLLPAGGPGGPAGRGSDASARQST